MTAQILTFIASTLLSSLPASGQITKALSITVAMIATVGLSCFQLLRRRLPGRKLKDATDYLTHLERLHEESVGLGEISDPWEIYSIEQRLKK
jgi:hypothetical protein